MDETADSGSEDGDLGIFKEPEDFYQPEKPPTTASHTMLSGQELTLRFVGQSPLWVGVSILHT